MIISPVAPRPAHCRQGSPSFWVIGALAACAVLPLSAAELVDVQLGLGGRFKVGRWVPIVVTLRGGAQDEEGWLTIAAPDGEGSRCIFESPGDRIQLPAGKVVSIPRTIRVGRWHEGLSIRFSPLQVGGAAALEQRWPLPATAPVLATQPFVVVFGDPLDLDQALRFRPSAPHEATQYVHLESAEHLPHQWFDYDGVDALIVLTADRQRLEQVGDRQWQAIERWTEFGGRLVLSLGSQGARLVGEPGPVARLAPGQFHSLTRQRETSELEAYAGSTQSLSSLWRDLPPDDRGIVTTRVRPWPGAAQVTEGAGARAFPWIVRAAFGLGSVHMLAFDLETQPIAQWRGRPRLLARLLDDNLGHDRQDDRALQSGQMAHLGFTDLSGQLRAAMEQFDGVRLVPFSLIAGLAALYVLLVGPADYFLLRKIAPRMEWTWLTFPAIVIGFCLLAAALTSHWKSGSARQNLVELVDAVPHRGWIRGTAWSHFYQPQARHHDVQLAPDSAWGTAAGQLLGWQGLPGPGFGGMESVARLSLGSDTYRSIWSPEGGQLTASGREASPRNALTQLPFPAASTRALVGQWWAPMPARAAAQLTVQEGVLQGQLENPLPCEIRDAVVCHGRWFYEVGTLPAGGRFQLDTATRPRDLRSRLTRRRIVSDKEIISPWDKAHLDTARILEMMMFHQMAGGRSYTGLMHRYQSQLDLSQHLQTGAAVLYGRLPRPATAWITAEDGSGDPRLSHWGMCRIVYPIGDPDQASYHAWTQAKRSRQLKSNITLSQRHGAR